MMPFVIIPTHQRIEITTINLKLLLLQEFNVIIIVSSHDERKHYSRLGANVVMMGNKPLGAKWQAGVNQARKLNAETIIILGSDDLLCKDFKEKYCNTHDLFTGFKKWYISHGNELYLIRYLINQPIGGGRIYKRELLDRIDWKLFDTGRNKLLDDYGWRQAKGCAKLIYEPEILAVKGGWPVLNPVDLLHENITHEGTYYGDYAKQIMKEKFNYDA